MKLRSTLFLVCASLCCAISVTARGAQMTAARQASIVTVKLKISGMDCEGCSMGLTKALQKVPGVKSARIEHAKGLGVVQYDPAKCKPAALLAAVKKGGYQASTIK